MLITYLTQWLEYRFHTAGVIGSNPIVGNLDAIDSHQWHLIK